MTRALASSENSRLLGVVAAVVAIATLYFARAVFIPLALALLSSVLLTPPVALLERIKFPRVLAIFLVISILVGSVGWLSWRTSQQFIDLTGQLPAYKKTIQDKIRTVKGVSGESLGKASATVKELEKEIGAAAPASAPAVENRKTGGVASAPSRPLPVEVVPPTNPLEFLQNMLGPLATAGVVIIFTIFILIAREDLRNRLIRLAGGGRLNMMTQALDEATQRINRYLFLQLMVNCGYGLIIFAALRHIGIPNASLWGVSAAVLRFLPYIGPPMAALMPIFLSLAVFPRWHHALMTAGVFFVLEVVVANFVEPFLYGAHIGLTPLAILVAAVFWTIIWGLPGLLLSTPMTVCLVVMGRYVPSLSFLNVLFGDEPVLPLPVQYYQRLLATDQNEARQILEQFLKEKPLEELYSSVVIPALSLAEQDRHRNELDEDTKNFIYQSTRELIEDLGSDSAAANTDGTAENSSELSRNRIQQTAHEDVLCIPARDDADDVVAMMLAQLLERQGRRAQSISIGTSAEMLSQVAEINPAVVCISALPPFAVDHARALYLKLRAQAPDLYIVVCLWHFEGDSQKAAIRLKLTRGHALLTTLPQVIEHIAFRAERVVSGAN